MTRQCTNASWWAVGHGSVNRKEKEQKKRPRMCFVSMPRVTRPPFGMEATSPRGPRWTAITAAGNSDEPLARPIVTYHMSKKTSQVHDGGCSLSSACRLPVEAFIPIQSRGAAVAEFLQSELERRHFSPWPASAAVIEVLEDSGLAYIVQSRWKSRSSWHELMCHVVSDVDGSRGVAGGWRVRPALGPPALLPSRGLAVSSLNRGTGPAAAGGGRSAPRPRCHTWRFVPQRAPAVAPSLASAEAGAGRPSPAGRGGGGGHPRPAAADGHPRGHACAAPCSPPRGLGGWAIRRAPRPPPPTPPPPCLRAFQPAPPRSRLPHHPLPRPPLAPPQPSPLSCLPSRCPPIPSLPAFHRFRTRARFACRLPRHPPASVCVARRVGSERARAASGGRSHARPGRATSAPCHGHALGASA